MPVVADWGGGVFADCLLRVQYCLLAARTMDGLFSAAVPLALADQLHFDDCKACLARFPCKNRYIRIIGFSFINWQQIGQISWKYT